MICVSFPQTLTPEPEDSPAYRNRDFQEEFAPGFSYFILSGLGQSRDRTPDCLGKVRPQVLILLASDCAHVGTRAGLQFGCLVWIGCPCQHVAITCWGGISFPFFLKAKSSVVEMYPQLVKFISRLFFVGSSVPSFGGRKARTEIFCEGGNRKYQPGVCHVQLAWRHAHCFEQMSLLES